MTTLLSGGQSEYGVELSSTEVFTSAGGFAEGVDMPDARVGHCLVDIGDGKFFMVSMIYKIHVHVHSYSLRGSN